MLSKLCRPPLAAGQPIADENVPPLSRVTSGFQRHGQSSNLLKLSRWSARVMISQVHMIRKMGFSIRNIFKPAQCISSNAVQYQTAQLFNRRCDAAFHDLVLKSRVVPFTTDVPTIICLARNEQYRIGAFIDHYVGLGARSIHIIDNNSEDKTAEIARRCPYVTVWRADGSYLEAEHGNLWRGALSRRYGLGKWIFNLDADEFIVYSDMEHNGLPRLQDWLTAKGKRSLCMPIIDMYPERIDKAVPVAHASPSLMNLIEESPYFDRPRKGLRSTCWIQRGHRGFELKGGVRLRMMHDILVTESPWVNVFPLVRWTDDTSYCSGSRHTVFPPQDNHELFYAALLHFKFVGNFAETIYAAVRDNQYWNNSIEYRRYAEWLCDKGGQPLVNDDYSVRFSGPYSVIEEKLLQSIDWDSPRAYVETA